MSGDVMLVTFGAVIAVLALASLRAAHAASARGGTAAPLSEWSLGGRQLGGRQTYLLFGGIVTAAYSYLVLPEFLLTASGTAINLGTYTIALTLVAALVLPRIARASAAHGFVTAADYVRARHDSPALALALAVTGLLAAVPYVVLQVEALRGLLAALGLGPRLEAYTSVALFALATLPVIRGGLRVLLVASVVKVVAVGLGLGLVFALLTGRGDTPAAVFRATQEQTSRGWLPAPVPDSAISLSLTLAFGFALLLMMYPPVVTAALAARGPRQLRGCLAGLPLWAALPSLFAFLAVTALATGPPPGDGNGSRLIPLLVYDLAPRWLAGALYGCFAVGTLVPASAMVVAAGTLVARNIHAEYARSVVGPLREGRVARRASVLVTAIAGAAVLLLPSSTSMYLHLLCGMWLLQCAPLVVVSPFTTWFHPQALLAGWATGMVVGSAAVMRGDDASALICLSVHGVQLYVAVVALALNLLVAALLTPLLDRAGVARGVDHTLSPHPDR